VVNNLHVGELGGDEVLVRVDDQGNVGVHFPQDVTRQPLSLAVELSAWAIDTHSEKNLLAIGANTHVISVFHLGMGVDSMQWTLTGPTVGIYPRLDLRGHTDNIPCVGFDRGGDYLASGSIDESVRLWSCTTGDCLKAIQCDQASVPPAGDV
jgi:WD40 repeat protein